MKKKEHTKPGKYHWMRRGILIALIAACIYTATYGYFENRVEVMQVSPLEKESTITWLCESNYLLYRDLYFRNNPEPVTYPQLYLTPKEGNEWIEEAGLLKDNEDTDFDTIYAGLENGKVSYEEWNNAVECMEAFRQYFAELENSFSRLNRVFDYRIEDLTTGEVVSNYSETESEEDAVFQLTFLYDEYGNVSVDGEIVGRDISKIRKTAIEAGRTNYLLQLYPLENEFFTVKEPINCKITYRVNAEDWGKLLEEGEISLRNNIYMADYFDFYAYVDEGSGFLFFLLFFLVLFGGMLLPAKGRAISECKLLHMVPEVVAALGILWACFTGECAMMLMSMVAGNKTMYVFLFNMAALTLVFFGGWFLGTNLRDVRVYGIKDYIKKRSIIYRFFPFLKEKAFHFYDILCHFDVTRNAHKLIIKIVLINAVILFIISSLWFGGFAITLIYSVLLYFLLRKYISDLQKKYSLLLAATNEIAQGNLNVTITEDLGVFEPFKPQILRIQNGFKNAVDEEVKSQRMKAELITNVSHDLKTPLTAIITYIDLLKDENLTKEQRKEYLDTLERKSLRLKVLIEDLFEVSKANSQNMTLNLMDVDIMNLLKQVAFEMADKLEANHLDLRMNLPEEKVVLSLDSQRTYRIYENLFGNIAKYALPGTRVYVTGTVKDDSVIITLKNITADEIAVNPEELTDRFVRGDTSRNTEGSGLGLAIAKSFTQLQGGELMVEVDGDLFKVTTVWKDTEF